MERKIWEKGYALGVFDPMKSTRIWNLPDYRQVELPDSAVILHEIRETPFYVGHIDDIFAAAFRLGAPIERVG